jgi:hypothetical protein
MGARMAELHKTCYFGLRLSNKWVQVEQGQDGGHPVNVWVASEASTLYLVDAYSLASKEVLVSGGAIRIRGIDRDPWFRFRLGHEQTLHAVRVDHPSHASIFQLEKEGAGPGGAIFNGDHVRLAAVLDEGLRWFFPKPDAKLWPTTNRGEAAIFTIVEKSGYTGAGSYCVVLIGYTGEVVFRKSIDAASEADAHMKAQTVMRAWNAHSLEAYYANEYRLNTGGC